MSGFDGAMLNRLAGTRSGRLLSWSYQLLAGPDRSGDATRYQCWTDAMPDAGAGSLSQVMSRYSRYCWRVHEPKTSWRVGVGLGQQKGVYLGEGFTPTQSIGWQY